MGPPAGNGARARIAVPHRDIDGEIAGYAYCAPWKLRPAYRHTVENSIYLAPQSAGRGLGTLLLQRSLPVSS